VPLELDTPKLALPGGDGDLPLVDAVAMLSESKDTLNLILTNCHPTDDIPCSITLDGFTPTSGTLTTMAGPSYDSINTFEQPDTVKLEARELAKDEWKGIVLPRHSAVAVTIGR